MLATLQKILAAPFDKLDQVQFRVEHAEQFVDDLMEIRKGQKCKIKVAGLQASMVDKTTGEVKVSHDSIEFPSSNISISIAVLEDGLIATITVSLEEKEIVKNILDSGIRGQGVEVTFEENYI